MTAIFCVYYYYVERREEGDTESLTRRRAPTATTAAIFAREPDILLTAPVKYSDSIVIATALT